MNNRILLAVVISAASALFFLYRVKTIRPYNVSHTAIDIEAGKKRKTEKNLSQLIRDLSDPLPLKAATAARTIGKLKLKDAVPELERLLKNPPLKYDDSKERFDEQNVLAGNDIYRRMYAIDALGKIGEKTSVPLLIELLETEPHSFHRAAAAVALGRMGDKRAVPPLRAALARTRNADVEREAKEALRLIVK